jgi:hypothetical protein
MDELLLSKGKESGINKKISASFGKLEKIKNELLIPEIQSSISEDRVNDICETWLKCPQFILTERPILVCAVKLDNANNKYYLIDGQHKLASAIKLYNEHHIDERLDVVVLFVESEEEYENMFRLSNMDSLKNKLCIDNDTFTQKKN